MFEIGVVGLERIKTYDEEFMAIAEPIINHKIYGQMKHIRHHNESVYEHCIDTAYASFRIAKKMKLDYISITRGCLLHDFYLYKFKRGKGIRFFSAPFLHAKNHPLIALENALEYFILNRKEQDIIKNHMFPIGFPRSKEAWIVTLVDKFLAVYEYSLRAKVVTMNKYKLLFNQI